MKGRCGPAGRAAEGDPHRRPRPRGGEPSRGFAQHATLGRDVPRQEHPVQPLLGVRFHLVGTKRVAAESGTPRPSVGNHLMSRLWTTVTRPSMRWASSKLTCGCAGQRGVQKIGADNDSPSPNLRSRDEHRAMGQTDHALCHAAERRRESARSPPRSTDDQRARRASLAAASQSSPRTAPGHRRRQGTGPDVCRCTRTPGRGRLRGRAGRGPRAAPPGSLRPWRSHGVRATWAAHSTPSARPNLRPARDLSQRQVRGIAQVGGHQDSVSLHRYPPA